MKILHVGQMIGGLEIYIRNTVNYASNEFEFVLAHGYEDHSKPLFNIDGKPVREYSIHMARPLRFTRDMQALIELYRIVRTEKPDLIHCHSAKGGVLGRVVGWMTGTKTCYTPHAFSFLSTSRFLKRFVYKQLERIARLDSYLLACSNSEGFLGRQIVWYPPEKCHVWSNSVPDARPMVEGVAVDRPIDKPYIVYIGRPSYQKNTLFLIDVVKYVHELHPEVQFLLLGLGFYSPDLEKLLQSIKDYGLEDVLILHDWAPQQQTLKYVDDSLFYLSMSRYEGLPLSIVEAMSLGKAIVASAVPGNTDCVTDRSNGRLLELDVRKFAREICHLIEHPEQVAAYGAQSRLLFERDFFLPKRIKELEEIYREIAGNS